MNILRARKIFDFASVHVREVTAAALEDGVLHAVSVDAISGLGVVTSSTDGVAHAQIALRGVSFVPTFVQPYLGGFLLVHARDRGRTENALAVDEHGDVRAHLALGDAIADVRTQADGTVWVSYFDEALASGAPGLAAFGPDGAPRFAYDATRAGIIVDAYAMNLAAPDDVWIDPYPDFPIVRIHRGRYHVWRCAHRGAHALAVRGERVLLVGGYEQRRTATVYALGRDGTADLIEAATIEGPDGEPLDRCRTAGYGADVLFYDARSAYVLDAW